MSQGRKDEWEESSCDKLSPGTRIHIFSLISFKKTCQQVSFYLFVKCITIYYPGLSLILCLLDQPTFSLAKPFNQNKLCYKHEKLRMISLY